jgi:hypothetical protein
MYRGAGQWEIVPLTWTSGCGLSALSGASVEGVVTAVPGARAERVHRGAAVLCTVLLTACSATVSAHRSGAGSASGHVGNVGTASGFDIAAENAKPGTTEWKIAPTAVGVARAVEGYTDKASVTSGESFRLFVSTTAPEFTATAYRFGYYGGTGARQIWQSAPLPGQVQAAPAFETATKTVECHWKPSLTVDTAGWREGHYLIKLVAVGGSGQRYVPITVRSTDTAGRVILVTGITTWQAYNGWGGYSLYGGPGGHSQRSRAVSFDRPYDDYNAHDGNGLFFQFDQGMVTFAEQHALPVAYETDLELEASPGLFKNAAAVVLDGHDEYYSLQMRDTLTAARDAGTNLAFLGANAVYRHIRWAPTDLGNDRLIICYKEAATDPMYGTNTLLTTQNWRDSPNPRPENTLTGAYYQCNPVNASYVVYDPANWIFNGTGAKQGSSFPGLIYPEYDRVVDIATTPHPIEVLSHSPLACSGHASFQESAYYTVKSGAGVFDAGTMQWVCALGTQCFPVALTPAGQAFVRTATLNLLTAFAQGPAGKVHPATDNTVADKVPGSPGLGLD